MSRVTWDLIKHSKRFYVNTRRRAERALVLSVMINIALGIIICYVYLNLPEPDYYATSGITPPIKLTSMAEKNYTSVPLLAEDAETDNENKVIPQ
jgi:intracellular multiplication protein IcmM